MVDTQRERRNFPGYDEKQYYTLKDMQEGPANEQAGTTDTDYHTDVERGGEDSGYASIYEKGGLPKGRPWKSSSPQSWKQDG